MRLMAFRKRLLKRKGGYTMNNNIQKREIAFPVAAIFCTLNALIGIIRTLYIYSLYGLNLNLTTKLNIISSILLVVVLFMRKRGPLLWLPLGIDVTIAFFSVLPKISIVGRLSDKLLFFHVVLPILGMLNGLLFLLFAVIQDWQKESVTASNFCKIWFIPGIMSVIAYLLEVYQIYLGMLNGSISILTINWDIIIFYFPNIFSGPLVSIPMSFLLGWWLTHPYKKAKVVC